MSAAFSVILRGGTANRSAAAWLMLTPVIIGLLVFAVFPSVYVAGLSVTKSTLGQPFKAWIGLGNYRWLTVGGDSTFLPSLARAALFSFAVAVVELWLGLWLAVLLTSSRRAGRLLRSVLLLPLMTPPVLVGVAWKLLLAPGGGLVNGELLSLGLIDAPVSFLGTTPWALVSIMVADVWQWTPFVTLLAYAALRQVPDDVVEAAMLDGAGPASIFWRIQLPLTSHLLLAIFVLRLIMAFKVFDLVYVLTFGGPGNSTDMSGFTIWRTGLREFDVGLASAQTVLFAAFVSIVLLPLLWLHRRVEEHAS
ncbi:MAG: sugar ABC transporter permease [Xanthobacteraceae bacterium]|nr:sugar ABC transporter permease [Xanthobacteraceae bacterium]